MSKNIWKQLASQILKAELIKRNIRYTELESRLAQIGVDHSSKEIALKLSRGAFTFAFFLECMKAIGAKKIDLADYFETSQNIDNE